MKIYLQFYRLYYVWFTIGWIAALYVYIESFSLPGALAVKVSLYVMLYYTCIFDVRKYWSYFQNNGYSTTRLYLSSCLADFIAFSALITVINLLLYAGS